MKIGNQPPAEPRAHPLFHAFQVGRGLIRRDHYLAVLVNQRVESVKEFLLGRFFAADELYIIDH
jgi:hypothetical protein